LPCNTSIDSPASHCRPAAASRHERRKAHGRCAGGALVAAAL